MWIKIIDELPAPLKLVALMECNSYMNMGNITDEQFPVCRVGYLDASLSGHSFWSCYGERGFTMDSFTHWAALPTFEDLKCFGGEL
jgi:hypothetical protein